MLPGLRLIAVSFLCGFVVMFVGLRAVFSLNIVHASLPVMAAQTAQSVPAGMIEPRGAPSAMPALYDLRLVASTVTPQLASLTVPIIERVLPEPAPPIEDAPKELPSELAGEPTPRAGATDERQASLAAERTQLEPPAAATIEPSAEPSIATPAEPMSDRVAIEPPPELLLEPISQPTASVESKVAVIATDPDAAVITIEAPKPAEAKLTKATVKPVRKKRARVASRAPTPQDGFGNAGSQSFGNQGGILFGANGNSFGSQNGNALGNQSGSTLGNQRGNSFGKGWN